MIEWSQPFPTELYAGIAIGFFALIWLARRIAISPKLKSRRLFVPRLIVFAGLLLILLNPVRRSEIQLPPRASSLTYLVDSSRSMVLDRPTSRIDQVRQAITNAGRQIPQENRPRIQLYGFGEELSAVPTVAQIEALEESSDLKTALERLPSRFEKDLPKSIVVFSDGMVDPTNGLDDLAKAYQRLGVPICVFPVGDDSLRGDVAIQELVVPRRAEPGTQVAIRTTVRSQGYEGERVVLQIRQAGAQEPLATLPVTLNDQPQPFELVIDADPEYGELVIEAPPLEGESISANNRVPFRLFGRPRRIRVLYMEGTASGEYKYIHDALTEDPDIECVSMVVNEQYASRPRLQRIGDSYKGYPATKKELFEFDVVICSDISQGAFTREQLQWTADLVNARGGGFVMIGGHTSFGSGAWDQTAWDKLIPVDMSGGTVGQGYLGQRFGVVIPEEAMDHPIWKLMDDPDKNRAALQKMPQFLGSNLIKRLKPAATLLGITNTPLPHVGVMPVFACESYGRGRTFAMATDSTEYWGRDFEKKWGEGDNRYFRKFWRNVIRWLTENSMAGSRRLTVDSDRVIYRPGDPIRITATAFDESFQETTDYRLVAELVGTSSDEDATAKGPVTSLTADSQLVSYSGELTAQLLEASQAGAGREFSTLNTARVNVRATDDAGELIGETQVDVQLLIDSRELQNPQAAPERLVDLAELSGGRRLSDANDLANLLAEFPATPGEVIVHRIPLWDRSFIWGVLLFFLAVEWSLRRLSGFG